MDESRFLPIFKNILEFSMISLVWGTSKVASSFCLGLIDPFD